VSYTFKWKPELLFAAVTFVVYVGGAFLLTGDQAPDSWPDWALATAVSGARAVVAAILPRLTGLLGSIGV